MSLLGNDKPPRYDLSNFTILVVEDSTYMQSLISSMLKVFGVGDIMVAEGAHDAMELLTVTQARTKSQYITNVDIVLMDWLMSRGSGKELLGWIRSHEKESIHFLPTVVVSGYTTETILSTARDMGSHEILVKPVSATGLASRICSVIETPRPFIKIPDYFGPDRRRKDLPFDGKDRRIMQVEQIETTKVKSEE